MAREHWIWFSELNIPLRTKLALLDAFYDPQMLYDANASVLASADVPLRLAKQLLSDRDMKKAEAIDKSCAKLGIDLVPLTDPRYPERLRNIDDPPILLYTCGELPDFDNSAVVAVVGTRRAPQKAVDIAARFSSVLAENDVLVVSGMASGIDTAANRASIASSGRTVAVLGCGLDICYPASAKPVYDSILSGNGCLISEYPPATPPLGRHFPVRNRIISGLSLGVLVVAAPARSGALITAHRAADQGRDVFVVPGGIDDPMYDGSNELIKQGAEAVTDPYDILTQYLGRYPDYFRTAKNYFSRLRRHAEKARDEEDEPAAASPAPVYRANAKHAEKEEKTEKPALDARFSDVWDALSADAKRIAQSIEGGMRQIDDIVEYTGLPAETVLKELTLLEIEGVVRTLPGKQFEIENE